VGAAATKCLVCGTDLTGGAARRNIGFSTRPRPPATPGLSAPALSGPVIGLILGALVLVGLGLILFSSGAITSVFATPTLTPTGTPPPTLTATPTSTETPVPTNTPLPPQPYSVVGGDTCISIAIKHNVSVQSILDLNKLDAGCILSIGQVLQIPQPTPTPTALPSATLSAELATQTQRTTYTVHAGDTCGGIANFYHLQVGDLMGVNGITDCALLREGQVLIIPLELAVTPGPSPTPTPYPPYPAPSQLVPADGVAFSGGEVITLQWASLGVLRDGEAYYVTIEDVTCNCGAVRKFATTETKLIVPADLHPADGAPHIFRWNVMAVRANGTSPAGQPLYDTAGSASPNRVFVWQ
jgi:LysM repeat protein